MRMDRGVDLHNYLILCGLVWVLLHCLIRRLFTYTFFLHTQHNLD